MDAAESAELKQALKHDPCTPALELLARENPCEADEAYYEVREGRDTAHPESWASKQL